MRSGLFLSLVLAGCAADVSEPEPTPEQNDASHDAPVTNDAGTPPAQDAQADAQKPTHPPLTGTQDVGATLEATERRAAPKRPELERYVNRDDPERQRRERRLHGHAQERLLRGVVRRQGRLVQRRVPRDREGAGREDARDAGRVANHRAARNPGPTPRGTRTATRTTGTSARPAPSPPRSRIGATTRRRFPPANSKSRTGRTRSRRTGTTRTRART